MSNRIIGLVGFIGSGKDSVATKLVETGCVQESFAGPLKSVCASIFGWDRELLEGQSQKSREFRETIDLYWSGKLGIKGFTPRLALQLIGTDVLRDHFNKDIWLSSLEYRILQKHKNHKCVIISDCRFVNELDFIKKLGGKVYHVIRGNIPEWYDYAVKANTGDPKALHIMNTNYRHIHSSEWDWVGYEFDYVVNNNGTLEDLDSEVIKINTDYVAIEEKTHQNFDLV